MEMELATRVAVLEVRLQEAHARIRTLRRKNALLSAILAVTLLVL